MITETDKVRVLLVEDDEDDYLLTRELLNEINPSGYELDWTSNYNDALEAIARDDHHVCLLDYRLGPHTGMELLVQARAKDYHAPIILLTGQQDRTLDLEAMAAGADDYLVKGELNADLLERSIRYSVANRRNERERLQLLKEQEARARAEEANRAKDEFLAMVSHELRNPLNAIIGWARVLTNAGDDPKVIAQAREVIDRSARIQVQLIDDLLDLARVAGGKFHLDVHSVDLHPVIHAALDAIRPASEAKNLRLETKLDPTVGKVLGDAARLQQVVSNLLSNAIKFTPEGGRIEIGLDRVDANVRIQVRDTGYGISADFLPYVFERFRQADEASGRLGGLGLGLALVRHIVEAHGGTVVAESEGTNRGATFTVSIPAELQSRT
ncbi:MAG TPA: hybrid sensor histidine kinase/response regulator [Pyrinomonadaceae bacterium]